MIYNQTELLAQLKQLEKSQLEELVLRLEHRRPDLNSHLNLASGEPTSIAIALIRLMRQDKDGLARLEQELNAQISSARKTDFDLSDRAQAGIDGMIASNLLREKLVILLPSQLEDLLPALEDFDPDMEGEIPGSEASKRAANLLRFLKKKPNGLDRLCELLGVDFGLPCSLLNALDGLLPPEHLPNDQILKQLFTEAFAAAGSTKPIPACTGKILLPCLIQCLADPLQLQNGKVPLLHFLAGLAPSLPALRGWINEAAADLALPEEEKQALDERASGKAPNERKADLYVLIALREPLNNNIYPIQAWYVNAQGHFQPLDVPLENLQEKHLWRMKDLMKQILAQPRKLDPAIISRNKQLVLEFFLPLPLLQWDMDDWTPPREDPLSAIYPLAVRSSERLENTWAGDWPLRWNRQCRKAFGKPLDGQCGQWLWQKPANAKIPWLNAEKAFFGLCFPPDEACLTRLLQDGAAIALWPRRPLNKKTVAALKKYLSSGKLEELPHTLHKLRKEELHAKQIKPGFFSLLWDDPRRMPDTDEQAHDLMIPEEYSP
ncbi:MAG: hypothetical protein GY862_12055 [Gammaproteobacteria bacterium]|nr:hypothetical protein [Gammaproteobacteria bacterium]